MNTVTLQAGREPDGPCFRLVLQASLRAVIPIWAVFSAVPPPGINGEQEDLTRYLSTLHHSEALSLVLTRSLQELLEAAGRAS